MTLEQSLPFLMFSLVAAITPGPSNVMITATSSAAGIVRGLPCVVGAAAGMAALLYSRLFSHNRHGIALEVKITDSPEATMAWY